MGGAAPYGAAHMFAGVDGFSGSYRCRPWSHVGLPLEPGICWVALPPAEGSLLGT